MKQYQLLPPRVLPILVANTDARNKYASKAHDEETTQCYFACWASGSSTIKLLKHFPLVPACNLRTGPKGSYTPSVHLLVEVAFRRMAFSSKRRKTTFALCFLTEPAAKSHPVPSGLRSMKYVGSTEKDIQCSRSDEGLSYCHLLSTSVNLGSRSVKCMALTTSGVVVLSTGGFWKVPPD